jgi:hypothetical protein
MHPDIAYTLARGRIDDLHRDAARRRLARAVAPRTSSRLPLAGAFGELRVRAARWVSASSRSTAADPACCPA